MSISEWKDWAFLSTSARWLLIVEAICLLGIPATLWAGWRHYRAARRGEGPQRGAVAYSFLLYAGVVSVLVSLWFRYLEVNHFPSQTMSEVLTVFCGALLLSMVVLHHALGLFRRGPGWAILGDSLALIVNGGALMTIHYIWTLPTGQRDLPPALQSYWFAPHIMCLVTSYAMLIIAAIICLIYFVTRFWSGVFHGGQTRGSQLLILAAFVLLPFVQVVTLPVLLLSSLVFWRMLKGGSLPKGEGLVKLEKELDEVSFRAFAVGIPFLTAGLWMGSFWAQEAWANYWGWDSKENSALICWLIFMMYVHLRMLGGYRGAKAMTVLMSGAFAIFITFQLFGYFPDSMKNSMHKYTDDSAAPQEGQQGPEPTADARLEVEVDRSDG